jgi:hypothetical protein
LAPLQQGFCERIEGTLVCPGGSHAGRKVLALRVERLNEASDNSVEMDEGEPIAGDTVEVIAIRQDGKRFPSEKHTLACWFLTSLKQVQSTSKDHLIDGRRVLEGNAGLRQSRQDLDLKHIATGVTPMNALLSVRIQIIGDASQHCCITHRHLRLQIQETTAQPVIERCAVHPRFGQRQQHGARVHRQRQNDVDMPLRAARMW